MKFSAMQHKKAEYVQQLQAIFQENGGNSATFYAVVQYLFEELIVDWSRAVEDLQQENATLRRGMDARQSLHRDARTAALEQARTYAEELVTANEELEAANEMLNSQNEELTLAQKIAVMERERYYELFDAAPEGYLVTDGSGRIFEANRTAGALLAIHNESLIGRNLLNFARAGSRATLSPRRWETPSARCWHRAESAR